MDRMGMVLVLVERVLWIGTTTTDAFATSHGAHLANSTGDLPKSLRQEIDRGRSSPISRGGSSRIRVGSPPSGNYIDWSCRSTTVTQRGIQIYVTRCCSVGCFVSAVQCDPAILCSKQFGYMPAYKNRRSASSLRGSI